MVDPNLTQSLSDLLHEINSILEAEAATALSDIGLHKGLAGVALFHFYYARHTDQQPPADAGTQLIREIVQRLNADFNIATYCYGMAGFGWVLDHLIQQDLVEVDADGLLTQLDEPLRQQMMDDFARGFYDHMHGALGYSLYFLQRYRNTQAPDLKAYYLGCMQDTIKEIRRLAKPQATGLAWSMRLEHTSGMSVYNLSLSHGIASMLLFLMEVKSTFDEAIPVDDLIRGGVEFIIDQSGFSETSRYPAYLPESGNGPGTEGRLAWCYGDLGVGLALWQAGALLHQPTWKEEALTTFLHASTLRSPEQTRIQDADFCHGALGVGAIFMRAYRLSQAPPLLDAAQHWLQEGLKMRQPNQGLAGFVHWSPADQAYIPQHDLLNGIAGIGLCLLSYLSEQNRGWEAALLIP